MSRILDVCLPVAELELGKKGVFLYLTVGVSEGLNFSVDVEKTKRLLRNTIKSTQPLRKSVFNDFRPASAFSEPESSE